jgi:hypothetical protein
MPPYRIEWLDEARTDIRVLDRPTAMRVFEGVLRISGVRHRSEAYRQGS